MAFAPYATLPELKAWVVLNDTIDDVVMSSVLNSVTRWEDSYCDTHFWRDGATGTEVARTFASNCGFDADIDDLVPGTVTTVKTDATGDGTFETTWSASDYQLQPVNRPNGEPFNAIAAVGSLRFPTWQNRQSRANQIEITGIWGWTAVPEPVKQACLIQSSRVLKRRYSPEGVIGPSEFGAVRVGVRLDPDVEQLLEDYTTTARGTGVLVA